MAKPEFTFTPIGKLGESISVQKMEGNGTVYFRITKLYKTKEGEWKPTDKGCSVPIDHCPSLLKMLEQFITENAKTGSTPSVELVSDVTELKD